MTLCERILEKLRDIFLNKWWIILGISVNIIFLGIILRIFFMSWFTSYLHRQLVLTPGSQTFLLWSKPPVVPRFNFYVYNVTNADEFMNNHVTPKVTELGPYVYLEHWEKVNIQLNDNGTITFNQLKRFTFNRELSSGSDEDQIVVPNIPLMSAATLAKAGGMAGSMISGMIPENAKAFIGTSVKQFLWGYPDEIMSTLADFDPSVPFKGEFGIRYGKNGTSTDNVTMFMGSGDMTKFALIDNVNGMTHLSHYYGDECNSLMGSDGSLFPPGITKNTTLKLYDKDLCRLLQLKFSEEVTASNDVHAYRFKPADNIFGTPDENPENTCFYKPGEIPNVPSGFADVGLCQFSAPVYLSFPHFYLANDRYRTRFQGISPPDPKKHSVYMDINPTLGVIVGTRVRMQLNIALSNVSTFPHLIDMPDIIFPVLWFEECLDSLPDDISNMINLAESAPPIIRAVITCIFIFGGVILLVISIWKLFKGTPHTSKQGSVSMWCHVK